MRGLKIAGAGLITPTGSLPIGVLANQTILKTVKIVSLSKIKDLVASGLITLATEDQPLIFVQNENVKIL